MRVVAWWPEKRNCCLRQYRGGARFGRVCSAADNATLTCFRLCCKKNVLNQKTWATRGELRLAMVAWIEEPCHRHRHRHRHRRRRQDGASISSRQRLAA